MHMIDSFVQTTCALCTGEEPRLVWTGPVLPRPCTCMAVLRLTILVRQRSVPGFMLHPVSLQLYKICG
jgi:hypothetical protein